jgi:hypothetical protein
VNDTAIVLGLKRWNENLTAAENLKKKKRKNGFPLCNTDIKPEIKIYVKTYLQKTILFWPLFRGRRLFM